MTYIAANRPESGGTVPNFFTPVPLVSRNPRTIILLVGETRQGERMRRQLIITYLTYINYIQTARHSSLRLPITSLATLF